MARSRSTLREAEVAELTCMLDGCGQAVVLLNRALCLTRFSRTAGDLFGLHEGDLERPVSELAMPIEGLCDQVHRVLEQGSATREEVQAAAGRWFVRGVAPAGSEEGGVVVSWAEQSPSRERLRIAAEVAQVGTFEWHIQRDVNIWTPELEALYGLPPGGFGGSYDAWRKRVHPDDLYEAESCVQEALTTGSFAAEWRALWPDGRFRWIEARAWVEKDAQGEPLRMIGVNLDITARKLAEQARHVSEERHRLALASGSLGTFTAESRSRTLTMDARAREILHLPASGALVLQDVYAKLHPEDREAAARALDAALGSHGRFELDARLSGWDGGPRWVRTRGQMVTSEQSAIEPYLIGVVQDITAQKRTEEALLTANRRKDGYLAMLGHELRNPLAAIRTTGEFIKMLSTGSPELDRAQAVLERQAAHMATLVDGLLDVSRITAGKLRVDRVPMDLIETLRHVVNDRLDQAALRGVRLEADFGMECLWLEGDAARLTQIFDNLLGNAVKFTDAGGHIRLCARREARVAVVSIVDDGTGFDPSTVEQLFETFQQGPQDLARSNGGLGLGLALAKDLVNLHGGSLEGHSAGVGQGATFTVRLPLHARPPAPANEQVTPEESALRVLVIEDNPDGAEMLVALLERSGHRARCASRGVEGVRIALEMRPDVVVCDLGLPDGMSGFDVARELRQHPPMAGTRLIALSGYSLPEDKRRCAEAGFDEHLTKPVDGSALRRALRSREGSTRPQ